MNRLRAWRFGWALAVLLGCALALPAQAADTVVYYHTDALHSVSVVTNEQGQVIERTHYAPYGVVLGRPMRNGPGYAGHQEDAATGLVYMQQRYYDPQTGRFLSVDPVLPTANGGNFNRYWYAKDNPYRYTDPDGRQSCGGPSDASVCRFAVAADSHSNGPNAKAKVRVAPTVVLPQLNEGQDIFEVAGKAIATDIAFIRGLLTHNQALMDEAANGFSRDVGTKGALAAVVALGTMGRGGEIDAAAPVGRLGSPMDVAPHTNAPGRVGETEYSGHAFDQMQGRGITPSVVKNTIETGVPSPGRNGATVYHDGTNNMTVITNSSGRVITVYPGGG